MTERTNTNQVPKWDIYLGKTYFSNVYASTYDKAIAAADYIIRKYGPPTPYQPVIVIPYDDKLNRRKRKDK